MPPLKGRFAAPSISAQDGEGQTQRPVELRSPMTENSAIDGPSSLPQETHVAGTHSSHRSVAISSEEEQLLNSKRHELLARSDWLGLAIVRPLQFEYSPTIEKDRIGKRRKIDKPAQRSKPAVRRLLTPLFQEAPAPQGAAMRATLPIDDMRIRIGTDAFESQTQRSRKSRKYAATSMRHSSVEFGPISEESMLLGDNYEGFLPPIPSAAASVMLHESPIASHATTAEWTQWHSNIDARSKLNDRTGIEQVDEWVARLSSAPRESLPPTQDDGAVKPFEDSALARTASQPSMEGPTLNVGDLEDSSCRKSDSESSGALMRQLLEIRKFTSSNASMSAVRSSSQHIQTSELSHRPFPDPQVSPPGESAIFLSTPHGVGTQDPDYTWHESREHVEGSSAAPSPSDWHSGRDVAQVPGQADIAEAVDMRGSEDRHKDCWRDFIIGSVDGSSQSSDQPCELEDDELDGLQHSNEVFATSSLPVSGLGSSDMAIGGSSLAAKRDTSDRSLGREEGSQWNEDDVAPLSHPEISDTPNVRIINENVRRTGRSVWPIDKSRYLPNIHIASNKQKTPIRRASLAHKSAVEAHGERQRATGRQAEVGVHADDRDIYDLPCSSDTG
ncbi:hypothetical protein KC327_g2097 [Hortaea werneckii]|nr:hypothetical protein KC350_g1794 [Hortaea werneckii]KAI6948431.1 hypothetical protein KC348_g1927 [Hortaea werneckii]KAI6966210.1 hypothetical protein KC329_g14950 [Hortaea werneckii]KAI6980452.1 hypothetical protein KC321_g1782 [Hortaea werneckii]KAI7078339.1 hypothetical protein KC327_g2097 [Hortaea werneckii]